ncbi:DNA-directed RNA polymerase subunit beta [Candidatus Beckwithbacteria bacterium]|nr:DNA-directed RNA polymerase subunit beta [Candidatus Beckwithbacteria bacterium]
MNKSSQSKNRIYLGKENLPLPELNLTEIQKNSYLEFLTDGIAKRLKEISPIDDFTGKNWALSFGEHFFEKPKLTPEQAREKGLNYEAAIKVQATLLNKKTGETIDQEVFLGDMPMMTSSGTFIINGIDRAVVSQLVRSPGVFFSGSIDPNSGKMLYQAELRPLRGSWLEFAVSRHGVISVKIDRHRKIPATTLLRAVGLATKKEILETFEDVDRGEELYIENTLVKDMSSSQEEALIEIYEKIRPGEPAVLDNAKALLKNLFFDARRYDLGKVGRYKLNRRLGIEVKNDEDAYILTADDIVATIKYLINLQNGQGKVDDIDHLANRRIRRVGELVSTVAFRVGLLRLERSIKEKMSMVKADTLITPSSLVNPRPMVAAISEFFRRNRLSTILDQTNPLSEIDNLRRLSVMGSGGVTRERASFSMRDINQSQYSRICPVRSPEGPNIGLVTYLSLYTRINEYGFLEAPYRRVVPEKKGNKTRMKVTNEVVYLSADEEENYYITHAEVKIDQDGYIAEDWVSVRFNGEFLEADVEQVQFIDVASRQIVGSSASLIPFLAHDEAIRALMGTHMQCQAVPLVKTESPIIGTGMEGSIAKATNHVVEADFDGEVVYADAQMIELKVSAKDFAKVKENREKYPYIVNIQDNVLTYNIHKFQRSSQSTCYSQKTNVLTGAKIKKGDVIIDGPAAFEGELSLGKNLLIAFGAFDGLGYEDAIVISDRLVKEDVLSSIHINEHIIEVMDTKLGPEEITRDIPNVGEADLAHLGEDGIVTICSNVGPNDILVGKIAPKGETELSAEERLLRAIFGEKAREVRDTSLRMPHGEHGTVIGINILDRDKGDELDPGVLKEVKVLVAQMRKVVIGDKVAGRHGNKGVISKIVPVADMPYLEDGTSVDIIISPLSVLARMNLGQILESQLGWAGKKLDQKYALPVFEHIDQEFIDEKMTEAGLPVNSKVQLYDGKTGEPYQYKTSVGVAYIMKLAHMVEDKMHARSTGPYSLVTQQPLGGKAQMGGQRLGEMEVWALEAHRVAHVLQEMLTIKSDDVVGRSKAFEAIVKGTDLPASTVPESFKVLVKELNSLGFNVIPEGVEEKEEVIDDPELKMIEADDKDLVLPTDETSEEDTQEKEVKDEDDDDDDFDDIEVPEEELSELEEEIKNN